MPTAKRGFGYCRVSSQGQNLDQQINALKAAGGKERDILTAKAGGRDFKRQAYKTTKLLLWEGGRRRRDNGKAYGIFPPWMLE